MSWSNRLLIFLVRIKYKGLYYFWKICSKLTSIDRVIIFDSFHGKQYSDNPRRISEVMHNLYPEFQQIWIISDIKRFKDILPRYVKCVRPNSLQFYFWLSRCISYVYNAQLEFNIFKRHEEQFFVQTWHGDIGFKKVLYDTGKHNRKILDDAYTDVAVAGSSYGITQYRSAFRYNGEIVKVGTPRNDMLVRKDKDYIERIKLKLSLPLESKILLYAPTFRDKVKGQQEVTVNLRECLDILQNKNENWICLTRAHVNSAGLKINEDSDDIRDVTNYYDMADLLCITDLLISDYSSCAGDIIRAQKGAILALFDRQEYEENSRELAYNPEEYGFIIANNQHELNTILENMSENDYIINAKKICDIFDVTETGKSADYICKRIVDFYNQSRN